MTEVWDYCLSKDISSKIVSDLYDNTYDSFYYHLNCHKLGINYNTEEDNRLIDELYSLFNDFGFDMTIFFRNLSDVNNTNESIYTFSEKILTYSLPYSLIVQKKRPTVSDSNLGTLKQIKNCILNLTKLIHLIYIHTE